MSSYMQRRSFLTLLGGAAAAWPLAARAQQSGPMRWVSVLMNLPDGDPGARAEIDALTSGLRELGWVAGRNIQFEYRWPGGDVALARAFAREVVTLKPDLVLTRSTPTTAAVLAESRTIPIIFFFVADPISSGFVASLARPGGSVTGFTNVEASMSGKWVELLKEMAPRTTRVAIMFNPETAPYFVSFLQPAEAAAHAYGIDLIVTHVASDAEIGQTLRSLASRPGGGLVVIPDTFLLQRRDMIVPLVHHHRLPAIYANNLWTRSGWLMAYAVDTVDLVRRAAGYVDRILKGANPADLPVQQPVKFNFVLNLKTAKTLGLDVPLKLHAFADEVLE
jgi:putative ABC transport system substrate-binding protein